MNDATSKPNRSEPASIFDLFHGVFDEKVPTPPVLGDWYRLYYLSGPGGSRPLVIECRMAPPGAELHVETATGMPGQPRTWGRGNDSWRTLASSEGAAVRYAAEQFISQVHNGSHADREGEFLDGAIVASEVSVAGVVTRVVRDEPNDGTRLSAFEEKMLELARKTVDGGVPVLRMRVSGP